MSKFNEVYVRLFFESTGNFPFDINEFKKFLDTAIKFKDGNIISEDKNLLIDITPELFNYCVDNQDQIIQFDKIKELMQESKHFFNIKNKNEKPLYFKLFNFDDESEIKDFIFKTFKIDHQDTKTFLEAGAKIFLG